jgi:hypothetical protein
MGHKSRDYGPTTAKPCKGRLARMSFDRAVFRRAAGGIEEGEGRGVRRAGGTLQIGLPWTFREPRAAGGEAVVTRPDYQCCFCGEQIAPEPPDLTGILVVTRSQGSPKDQQSQQLYCHLECLSKQLHASVPLYISLFHERSSK